MLVSNRAFYLSICAHVLLLTQYTAPGSVRWVIISIGAPMPGWEALLLCGQCKRRRAAEAEGFARVLVAEQDGLLAASANVMVCNGTPQLSVLCCAQGSAQHSTA